MQDEVIDKQAIDRLLDMIGGDPEDLQELLDEFEQSAPGIVAHMRAAADDGDLRALRIDAHSLKSNATDMGARRLSAMCAALEAACRDETVEDPAAQIEAIEEELTRARAALTAMTDPNG
jgi:HPt (histidine-containing phosphotransfer) domain-containing protein